jgi:hypothetical protein
MKKKSLILTAAAVCSSLILAGSIGSAFAYFSTYERALGGYAIHLDDYEEITEDFHDWTKNVRIKNKDNSTEHVFVRVKAFAGKQAPLVYSAGPEWSPAADGYYYYAKPLAPGEETTQIDVKITDIPISIDPQSFNVVVVYECAPARYHEDGTAYADWDQEYEVTYFEGGDN